MRPSRRRSCACNGERYHALAKERTMLLRCESLEPSMTQLGPSLQFGVGPWVRLSPELGHLGRNVHAIGWLMAGEKSYRCSRSTGRHAIARQKVLYRHQRFRLLQ